MFCTQDTQSELSVSHYQQNPRVPADARDVIWDFWGGFWGGCTVLCSQGTLVPAPSESSIMKIFPMEPACSEQLVVV